MSEWPAVCAVVPTRDRPALLAQALAAILDQDYPGALEVVVVLDQPPTSLVLPDVAHTDRVRVLDNQRTPGLAGARNTGILAADTPLVAFCDDDDLWLPDKLRRQVAALHAVPDADFATCGIEVRYAGTTTVRRVGSDRVGHAELLRKRLPMLHSSTFVVRREAMLAEIGLLDEDLPFSQNEDWDLLLRASAVADLVNVDDPLVAVTWWARSYFASDWTTKIASLQWMLDHHPDLAADRRGAARVYGQIGFAYAAARQRGAALRWALRALRSSWREPRGYVTMASAAGVPAEVMLRALNKRGHGI